MVTIITRIADNAFQMAGTVILARLLSPEDYGLVAMVTAVSGLLMVFRDMGLSDAVIQSQELSHPQISTLFWINLLLNAGLSLVISLCGPVLTRLYHEPRVAAISIVMSASFVLLALSDLHFALLRRAMRFVGVAIWSVVASIVSTAGAIVLALKGFGYWALVGKAIISAVVTLLFGWVLCGWRPGLPRARSGARPLLRFGANSVGFLILNYCARNLDNVLIGWRHGAVSLGYYQKAFSLFLLPVMILSVHSVAVPTLARLRNEPIEYRRFYLRALSAVSFFAMPVSAFMAAYSPEIVIVLLGAQWESVSPLLCVLSISAGVYVAYTTSQWLHVSLGRSDRWIRWGAVALCVTAASYVIAVFISTLAVAIACSGVVFLLAVPGLAYAGKPVGLTAREILSVLWRHILSAAIAALLCRYLNTTVLSQTGTALKVAAGFPLFSGAYLGLTVLLHWSTKPLSDVFSLVRKGLDRQQRR